MGVAEVDYNSAELYSGIFTYKVDVRLSKFSKSRSFNTNKREKVKLFIVGTKPPASKLFNLFMCKYDI